MNQEAILDINILEIIPQRAPMVMIDNLLYADEKKTISSFEIKTDCIFIEKESPEGLCGGIGKLQQLALAISIKKKANQPLSDTLHL